jgi:hypothetical protein
MKCLLDASLMYPIRLIRLCWRGYVIQLNHTFLTFSIQKPSPQEFSYHHLQQNENAIVRLVSHHQQLCLQLACLPNVCLPELASFVKDNATTTNAVVVSHHTACIDIGQQ